MSRLNISKVLFFTLLAVSSLWPFSGAEDVANARENIFSAKRTDFWGGFSQLFYSSFRMDEPTWHIAIGLFHAGLILLGTLVSLRIMEITIRRKTDLYLLMTIHFIATIYVLNLSRDASLLSFAWLGTSLIFSALYKHSFKTAKLTMGVTLIVIGLSFRPWLAVSFAPFILAVIYMTKILNHKRKNTLFLVTTTVILVAAPLLLDSGSKKVMNLKESFPEQQVIIFDMVSLVCLSSEKSTQFAALSALKPISALPDLNREKLCGQFYPQNWASPIFYSDSSKPALRMIASGDYNTYLAIRNSWLDLISSKPAQYLQLKFFQISQLFLAGDSFELLTLNLRKIPTLPYEILKTLRLFSFLPILLLFSWMTYSYRTQVNPIIRYAILSTYLLTICAITVAFVGDNQRYISWLAMLLFFAFLNAPRSQKVSVS